MQSLPISSENFTDALELTHNFNPNISLKERMEAEKYLMDLRAHPQGLNLSFHIISNETVNEIRCFWAFNTIMYHLPHLAATIAQDQAEELYKTLFSFIYRYLFSSSASSPTDYLINKHAQLMVVGLHEFYPKRWESFFDDIFELRIRSTSIQQFSEFGTIYFLRVFEYIDERVVSLRERTDRDRQQRARDMEIKDAMRAAVIPKAVSTWYSILNDTRFRNPDISKVCLSIVQTYIEWVDVGLFMTPDWIHMLYFLTTVQPLRISACECLLSLIEKKQLPGIKMDSLRSLNVVDALPRIVSMLEIPPGSEEALGFVEIVTRIVAAVADQFKVLLETCFQLISQNYPSSTLGNTPQNTTLDTHLLDRPFNPSPELLEALEGALHRIVSQLLCLFRADLYETNEILLPFIQAYAKSPCILQEEACDIIHIIFEHTKINHIAQNEDHIWDDSVAEQRKVLHILTRVIFRSSPNLVLDHLQASIMRITESSPCPLNNSPRIRSTSSLSLAPSSCESSSQPVNKDPEFIEAVLRYFYEMGEAVKLDRLKSINDIFSTIMVRLLSSENVVNTSCGVVHLSFYEVMDRYYPFFTYHQEYIPILLQRLLLTPYGVKNPNDRARSRICYLFGHLVQVLKHAMLPFASEVVKLLQSTATAEELYPSDRRELYEALGTLLGLLISSQNNSSKFDGSKSHELKSNPNRASISIQHSSTLPNLNLASAPIGVKEGKETPFASLAIPGQAQVSEDEPSIEPFPVLHEMVQYLTSFLRCNNPYGACLPQNLEADSPAIVIVAENISYLTSLSKGLEGCVPDSPEAASYLPLSQVFTFITDEVMNAFTIGQASLLVRDRVGQFFHQMINLIGHEVLSARYEQYVICFLQCMESPNELSKLLRLMFQAVNRFGAKSIDTVRRLLPLILEKASSVGKLYEVPPVVLGVVSESAKERIDIYRQLFTFVFSCANAGCGSPVLELEASMLETLLQQLLFSISIPAELELPKIALQTFSKLTTETLGMNGSSSSVDNPSNRAIIYDRYLLDIILPKCTQAISSPSFDLKDAKNFILVGEVGQLIKAAYQRLGDVAVRTFYDLLAPFLSDPSPLMEVCNTLASSTRLSTLDKGKLRQILEMVQQKHV